MIELDLNNPNHAYFIGFAQADGTLCKNTRNRGKFQIELQYEDGKILEDLSQLLDCNYSITNRIRDTNFKKGYHSCCLSVHDKGFRDEISKYIPYGKKSNIVKMPQGVKRNDYFRGIIDGDGSVGFTSNGYPFVSLVTDSEFLAKEYIQYIKDITNKEKHTTRNSRDGVFNICVLKEDAQKLVKDMYYENCLSLQRKYEKAKDILKWQRPKNMKVRISKRWDDFQDEYILTHSIEDSMSKLNRSKNSICCRLNRLKNDVNY